MTPDHYTIAESFLDVGDGHQLYVHDWGRPDVETPILFLHGGPGTGNNDGYKTSFDPRQQRVIFFDQRGAGRSLPHGSLQHNTTNDLTQDIEKVSNHLKLTKFILTGGSWGSCLALAYALEHPERIKAIVLRGIFTGTKSEIAWLASGGYRNFFPDVWQTFVEQTPPAHAKDPAAYHFPRILGKDTEAAKDSAFIFGNVEGALLKLDDRYRPPDPAEYDPTFVKFETHYMVNNCFLPDNYILDNAHLLDMPVWLIQGRYDTVCPPITAWKLHQQLPNSELVWTMAGHANDRSNYDAYRTLLLHMARDL
jgi:proline iminopeptidase